MIRAAHDMHVRCALGRGHRARVRGVILPVVLALVGFLAMTLMGFVFFVRAETAGSRAHTDGHQARLAAESGLESVIAVLRAERDNSGAWYDVPARFRHELVWSQAYDRENDPVRETRSRTGIFEDGRTPSPAWRFSVCAARDDVDDAFRYGLTPENGKLNLNSATDQQLEQLITPLLLGLQIDNPQAYLAALLDWRDADDDVRENGAENEYYNTLTPAYSAKNGRFDTVEELLLVKGWSAVALYGEDTNGNGLLDPNEDDGAASPPEYDNADGTLNRGVAGYLTVWSREPDTALDNKPRIPLAAAAAQADKLAELFPNGELSPETIAYVLQNGASVDHPAKLYTQGATPAGGGPGGFQQSGGDASGNPDEGAEGDEGGDADPSKRGTAQERAPGGNRNPGPPGGNRNPGPPGIGGAPEGGEEAAEGQPASPDVRPPPRVPQGGGGTVLPPSPVTLEELPYLVDRFTGRSPSPNGIEGLININTAALEVLLLIPGITPEAAGAIYAARRELDPAEMRTIAWPLVAGVIDTDTFHRIAPWITAKSYQFRVEVVGYSDHLRVYRRYEWMIEMLGPMAQVRYRRDLTGLGFGWPVDTDQVIVETQ